MTALMWSGMAGNITVVKTLLAVPAIDVNKKSINAQFIGGMTALIHFARCNLIELVELLLAVPAIDVNAKNDYNDSALFIAVRDRRLDMTELLLSHGAVVDTNDDLLAYFNLIANIDDDLQLLPLFSSSELIRFLSLLLAHQSRSSPQQYYETMIVPLVSFGQRYHHLQSQVADMMRELNWQTRKHFLSFLDINSKTSTLNEQQGVGLVTLVVADMLSKMNRIIVEYI